MKKLNEPTLTIMQSTTPPPHQLFTDEHLSSRALTFQSEQHSVRLLPSEELADPSPDFPALRDDRSVTVVESEAALGDEAGRVLKEARDIAKGICGTREDVSVDSARETLGEWARREHSGGDKRDLRLGRRESG